MNKGCLKQLVSGFRDVDNIPLIELLFIGKSDSKDVLKLWEKYKQKTHEKGIDSGCKEDFLFAIHVV